MSVSQNCSRNVRTSNLNNSELFWGTGGIILSILGSSAVWGQVLCRKCVWLQILLGPFARLHSTVGFYNQHDSLKESDKDPLFIQVSKKLYARNRTIFLRGEIKLFYLGHLAFILKGFCFKLKWGE